MSQLKAEGSIVAGLEESMRHLAKSIGKRDLAISANKVYSSRRDLAVG
jgi:hypothetical protein